MTQSGSGNAARARAARISGLGAALLGAAVLGAGLLAAPAGAGTANARPAWSRAGLTVTGAGAPSRARTEGATPFAFNPNICWQQSEADTAGDAATLDIVSATLQYDCSSKLLTLSARTAAAFATSDVHDFFGAFDIDNNSATGCGGSDLYADAAWVPTRNEMLAAVFTESSCSAQPVLKEYIDPKRSDSHHLSVSFDPSSYFPHLSSFNWNALMEPDAEDFDVVGSGSLFHASIPNFPPSGSTAFSEHTPSQIGGAFNAILPGKFAGNGATDLLLYRAGRGADALWTNDGSGHFGSTPLTINGSYNQLVAGDFNHDGHTDILFYLAGPAQDFIWFGNGAGHFSSHPFTINGRYRIVAGDYNGDGYSDLLFYAPGGAQDYIWTFHNGGYTSRAFTINGSYNIIPADVTGDGRTDLLFYAPGSAPDYIWNSHPAGAGVEFGSHAYPIYSSYTNVYGGDFDGNGHDDLFFWSRGWGRDALLRGTGSAPFLAAGSQTIINEYYNTIVVGDFNNDGKADMFLVQFGTGADKLWEGS